MALVVAVTAALIVSLTAVVVLSLAYQRYHLAWFQSSREDAYYNSLGGIWYADARLTVNDTNPLNDRSTDKPPTNTQTSPPLTFRERVMGRWPKELVVSSDPAKNPDHLESNLKMGSRHVTVRILWIPPEGFTGSPLESNPTTKPFRVNRWSDADYGN